MLHDSLSSLQFFTHACSHAVSQELSPRAADAFLYGFASAFMVAIQRRQSVALPSQCHQPDGDRLLRVTLRTPAVAPAASFLLKLMGFPSAGVNIIFSWSLNPNFRATSGTSRNTFAPLPLYRAYKGGGTSPC